MWIPKKLHSPTPPAPSKTIANVYQLKTKPEVICYLHAAAGFPTKSTWYSAVNSGKFYIVTLVDPEDRASPLS